MINLQFLHYSHFLAFSEKQELNPRFQFSFSVSMTPCFVCAHFQQECTLTPCNTNSNTFQTLESWACNVTVNQPRKKVTILNATCLSSILTSILFLGNN